MKLATNIAFAVFAVAAPVLADDGILDAIFPPGAAAKQASDGGFVIEDPSGNRTGALRPGTNGYIIEDAHGQRVGSVEYDAAHDTWKIEEYSLDGMVARPVMP